MSSDRNALVLRARRHERHHSDHCSVSAGLGQTRRGHRVHVIPCAVGVVIVSPAGAKDNSPGRPESRPAGGTMGKPWVGAQRGERGARVPFGNRRRALAQPTSPGTSPPAGFCPCDTPKGFPAPRAARSTRSASTISAPPPRALRLRPSPMLRAAADAPWAIICRPPWGGLRQRRIGTAGTRQAKMTVGDHTHPTPSRLDRGAGVA